MQNKLIKYEKPIIICWKEKYFIQGFNIYFLIIFFVIRNSVTNYNINSITILMIGKHRKCINRFVCSTFASILTKISL